MNRPGAENLGSGDERYASTAQVANALGVSVTTVKRWVDDGILPAHRTPGGHRKLMMVDVLRIVKEGQLPQADLTKLIPRAGQTPDQFDDLLSLFQQAVRDRNTEQVRSLILGAYQNGLTIESIADRLISPGMKYVGHEWSRGRVEVFEEHRVSQSVIAALYELRAFLRHQAGKDRPVAVGGAPEHDHYAIPTLLAKLTLLDAGWDAINLGPHTPMSAFIQAMDDLKPTLLWLSVSHLEKREQFLADYVEMFRVAEELGVAVAIGGRVLQESDLRQHMNYSTFTDGMTQFASFARSINRRAAPRVSVRTMRKPRPQDEAPPSE
jgi:MerR family transcriptional regulator, light-induced transcriptional regulator